MSSPDSKIVEIEIELSVFWQLKAFIFIDDTRITVDYFFFLMNANVPVLFCLFLVNLSLFERIVHSVYCQIFYFFSIFLR